MILFSCIIGTFINNETLIIHPNSKPFVLIHNLNKLSSLIWPKSVQSANKLDIILCVCIALFFYNKMKCLWWLLKVSNSSWRRKGIRKQKQVAQSMDLNFQGKTSLGSSIGDWQLFCLNGILILFGFSQKFRWNWFGWLLQVCVPSFLLAPMHYKIRNYSWKRWPSGKQRQKNIVFS